MKEEFEEVNPYDFITKVENGIYAMTTEVEAENIEEAAMVFAGLEKIYMSFNNPEIAAMGEYISQNAELIKRIKNMAQSNSPILKTIMSMLGM